MNHFVSIDDVVAVRKSHGRNSRLLLTELEMGARGYALGEHTMDTGGMTPPHVHEGEQEAMFFIAGSGWGRVGDEVYDLKPGVLMFAPAGQEHEIRNTGTEPLRFVWVYSPPLPSHFSQQAYHAANAPATPA